MDTNAFQRRLKTPKRLCRAGETRAVTHQPIQPDETLPFRGMSFFRALHRSTTHAGGGAFGGFHPPYVMSWLQPRAESQQMFQGYPL